MDEDFHRQLLGAAGNPEMARIHHELAERIRIIRRLDFTQPDRIDATYAEHSRILRHIMNRELAEAQQLLRGHIEASKAVVRQITCTASFGAPGERHRSARLSNHRTTTPDMRAASSGLGAGSH